MVDAGFKIQVGASTTDNSVKDFHLRMDRVTTSFDVGDTVVSVANPLGGNLYLRVPYEANLGAVTLDITGGVVQAPIFSSTSLKVTSESEWNSIRTAPGPWADFETDKFLMQVPRIWIYDFDYAHISNLMSNYDLAMDGVSELVGFPPDRRNDYVLYLSADLHIMYGVYGIGYPQVNELLRGADSSGILPSGPEGASTHWMVNDPMGSDTEYHELGHSQLRVFYRGETEAQCNLLYAYVQNVKFGQDLDQAFINSFSSTGLFTIDKAAINWMITVNFRESNEMDYSNTEMDEFRYQHRGYAKYADIARLFGWEAVRGFYYQDNLDYEADNPSLGDNLPESDQITLLLSVQAGVNLTPLIRTFGVFVE